MPIRKIIVILMMAAAVIAAKEEGTDFRLSGVLETGFDVIRNVDDRITENRMINRGEIEISARPIRGLRAEMGLEFNQRGTTHDAYPFYGDASEPLKIGPYVTIDKFYAHYNLPGVDGQIRAGIMKKAFGLEERSGVDERYFHSRSRINDRLDDEYGFLDHDLTLMYRHDIGKNFLRFVGAFSWSVADSNRYLQNYSVQYEMDENLRFILATVIRHDHLSDDRIVAAGFSNNRSDKKTVTTFVSSLNAQHVFDPALPSVPLLVESDIEITGGINPSIRLNRPVGNRDHTGNRRACIFGVRVQERFPIPVSTKTLTKVIPVLETSLFWDDYDSGRYETELRMGLTLGFTKKSAIQLRNSFGIRWQTNGGESEVERYRYNLQAVVIF